MGVYINKGNEEFLRIRRGESAEIIFFTFALQIS